MGKPWAELSWLFGRTTGAKHILPKSSQNLPEKVRLSAHPPTRSYRDTIAIISGV